jgi:hypothetical protein
MDQENTKNPKLFYKEIFYLICAIIPAAVGRFLRTPSSVLLNNETLEYSLGSFLVGTGSLLIFLWYIRIIFLIGEGNFKKPYGYFWLFLWISPFAILWIWCWIQALNSFIQYVEMTP